MASRENVARINKCAGRNANHETYLISATKISEALKAGSRIALSLEINNIKPALMKRYHLAAGALCFDAARKYLPKGEAHSSLSQSTRRSSESDFSFGIC